MQPKSGERTLLASVILSAPGPIVVGAGLLLGRSSTQYADFARRTAELVAIIVSWLLFRALHRHGTPDPARKSKLEGVANAFVGGAMCLSGAAMLLMALFSSHTQKGNVIPGLVIALLGVTANTWFWFRYRALHQKNPDAILAVQSRLYRAKALVDACVTIALATVFIAPDTPAAQYMDVGGSIMVAIYLIANGIAALRGKKANAQSGPLP